MTPTPGQLPDELLTAEEFIDRYGDLSGIELVDGRVVWANTGKPICEHCLRNAIPDPEDPDE